MVHGSPPIDKFWLDGEHHSTKEYDFKLVDFNKQFRVLLYWKRRSFLAASSTMVVLPMGPQVVDCSIVLWFDGSKLGLYICCWQYCWMPPCCNLCEPLHHGHVVRCILSNVSNVVFNIPRRLGIIRRNRVLPWQHDPKCSKPLARVSNGFDIYIYRI